MTSGSISLSWYAYPHNAALWDGLARDLAQSLRSLGLNVCHRPDFSDAQALVSSGAFALAYCCGVEAYRYRDTVEPVAAPIYSHSGDDGFYRSVVLVDGSSRWRTGSLDQLYQDIVSGHVRVAVNQRYSWSGSLVALQELGSSVLQSWLRWPTTGAHLNSLRWLIEGKSDAVFLDETSWAMLISAKLPGLRQLRVIGKTGSMPRCPIVVPKGNPSLRRGVKTVLGTTRAPALGLTGFYFAEPDFWLERFGDTFKRLGLAEAIDG